MQVTYKTYILKVYEDAEKGRWYSASYDQFFLHLQMEEEYIVMLNFAKHLFLKEKMFFKEIRSFTLFR